MICYDDLEMIANCMYFKKCDCTMGTHIHSITIIGLCIKYVHTFPNSAVTKFVREACGVLEFIHLFTITEEV